MDKIQEESIKQALLELPLPQRTVCVALQYVQEQIKKIAEEEQQEIQKTHLQYLHKFKALESRTSSIIKGRPLKENDMQDTQNLFTLSQMDDRKKIMGTGYPLQKYWRPVLLNSQLASVMTETDENISQSIENIQTNITKDTMEIIITILPNTYLKNGRFTRRIKLENGIPVSFEGDQIQWLNKPQQGLFHILLNDTKQQEQINLPFQYLSNIINQLIPYSLEYYLGLNLKDQSYGQQQIDENQQEAQDQENQQK